MALSKIDVANMVENEMPQANIDNNINFRNIIINGDMSIAQRSTSVSSISSTATYNTIDRWRFGVSGLGTWTQSQSTDVPSGQGFAKSFKLDCTATGTLSASDYLFVNYQIEGQHVQYLKKGTSNAKSLTLSFWVKSNKTGTYTFELDDNDNNRSISKTYTVDSANTWEKKTITIEGDTTGTLDNDNNNSLRFYFWLGAGSDYTSGTLQTSWQSTTNANRVSSSNVNLADSTSNEWYITGVQLEAGTTASDFEFLPLDVNLNRCERYFQKSYELTTAVGTNTAVGSYYFGLGFDTPTRNKGGEVDLNPRMRAAPTVTGYSDNGTSGKLQQPGGGTTNLNVVTTRHSSKHFAGYASSTSGTEIYGHWTADAEL